jgi:hypothetical protein
LPPHRSFVSLFPFGWRAGTHPVTLSCFHNAGVLCVFACCDRPTVVYTHNSGGGGPGTDRSVRHLIERMHVNVRVYACVHVQQYRCRHACTYANMHVRVNRRRWHTCVSTSNLTNLRRLHTWRCDDNDTTMTTMTTVVPLTLQHEQAAVLGGERARGDGHGALQLRDVSRVLGTYLRRCVRTGPYVAYIHTYIYICIHTCMHVRH